MVIDDSMVDAIQSAQAVVSTTRTGNRFSHPEMLSVSPRVEIVVERVGPHGFDYVECPLFYDYCRCDEAGAFELNEQYAAEEE